MAKWLSEQLLRLEPARRVATLGPRQAGLPERYVCHRLRVLVVDELALVGQQITHLLRTHEVLATTNAETALEAMAQADRLDAILYELTMPGLSGPAFADALFARYPEVLPRLIFTLRRPPSWQLASRLAALGVPWITKPFRYAELVTAVELASRAPQVAAVTPPALAAAS